jgi:signal transduction histidine kinase
MMLVPLLLVGLGLLAVVGYFTRERVTWTNASPKGGVGMAILIFIIFAVIGYFLDSYLGFSLVWGYMYAVGGALQAIALVFIAAFILLMCSMAYTAYKTGQMVS